MEDEIIIDNFLLKNEEHKLFIEEIWLNNKGYKNFWSSYFYMITRPKKCLRLINFSIKMLGIYVAGD